ncbi:MAG: MFS transporter [Promethearchaeota archaeon]
MVKEEITSGEIKRYSKKILASFQLGNFVNLMMSQMYSQQLAFFYQSEVGIAITLYFIAQIIYMIWNMINDPLLGYFCDRSTRFIKYGKRFPWILLGAIPYCFMVIIIYAAPKAEEAGQATVFLWFLLSQCLMDTFFSLYDINRFALFPDKIRHNKDRRIAGTITTYLETSGVLTGVLVPVLIIEAFGTEKGYLYMSIIISAIALAAMLMMIPGVREDKEIIERRIHIEEKKQHEPFFSNMKDAIKDRNFMGFMIFFVCYSGCMGLVMASLPFVVRDILQMSKIGELFVLFYIFGVIFTTPAWYKLSFKIGIKRTVMICGTVLGSIMLLFLVIPLGEAGIPIVIIGFIAAGCVDGGVITMNMPLFSSVVDKATINTGSRREGLYKGTWMFFARLSIAIQSAIFWFVQTFFQYDPRGNNTPAQLIGLRIQVGVFPIIIMLIGVACFALLYRITPEEMEANTLTLRELKL